ncbi:MAG TPA: HNH endonuclease signature motif containing protein, partial [Jatrophihabitantaceae bacterium]|nr:HNH endonuclease signature motif containing protein [Jatrophihabitantaceae bacterium]
PVAQGVAVYAALGRAADTNIASGDERGRGQVMADTLVERVTGQTTAAQVPVEVNLVIDTDTLLGNGTEPALIDGLPIPAATGRELALHPDAPRWLRRLYTRPQTGELVAMDTRRRLFTRNQRRFIALRDQTCRTPWCEAPIRHTDHIHPAQRGGPTSLGNGGGLCVACNIAKQAPGWHARPGPAGRIDLITPTGHRYTSRPPSLPGARQKRSPLEQQLLIELRRHAA